MSSFFGHAIPGLLFIILGIWWTLQIFLKFYNTLHKGSCGRVPIFQSAVTFPVHIRGYVVHLEGFFLIICSGIGLTLECILPLTQSGFVSSIHMLHTTMYLFFGMAGLVIVTLPQLKIIPYCDDVAYLMLSMCYLVEGLLFKFHLSEQDKFSFIMHTLAVYTVFASAAVTLVEMKNRNSIWPPVGRAFLSYLQGTWFWQIAFVFYPPSTNLWGPDPKPNYADTESSLMFISCVFTWHMAVISMLMIVCSACIGCFYRKKGWLDEEALMNNQYTCSDRGIPYSYLKQSGLKDIDELDH